FATSKSLLKTGLKVVIIDECDRLSAEAQDSLKGLIELTAKKARYIFITNHLERVIPALISRTQEFSFGVNEAGKKDIVMQYFKRACFILDSEQVPYDKKIVAKLVTERYPDFRKVIQELQKFFMMNGEINEFIFNLQDESLSLNLIEAMKAGKVDDVRKLCSSVDPVAFFKSFYFEIKKYVENESLMVAINVLNQGNWRHGVAPFKEVNLADCCFTLMQEVKWKKKPKN
ncbi:unnamed protein product, partial [marine sediment metagenome]